MKKNHSDDPDILREYDFRAGQRGRYAKRFLEGSNVVVLEPDVAREFPDAATVNKALKTLIKTKSAGSGGKPGRSEV